MTKSEYKSIYDIVGAAQEAHKTLGRGLTEPFIKKLWLSDMDERGMEYEREKALRLYLPRTMMEKVHFADFYYQGVVIELKAVETILSN